MYETIVFLSPCIYKEVKHIILKKTTTTKKKQPQVWNDSSRPSPKTRRHKKAPTDFFFNTRETL